MSTPATIPPWTVQDTGVPYPLEHMMLEAPKETRARLAPHFPGMVSRELGYVVQLERMRVYQTAIYEDESAKQAKRGWAGSDAAALRWAMEKLRVDAVEATPDDGACRHMGSCNCPDGPTPAKLLPHEWPAGDTFWLDMDGEGCPVIGAEFLRVNELDANDTSSIRSLKVGETYKGGGGAQPVWTLRRVS